MWRAVGMVLHCFNLMQLQQCTVMPTGPSLFPSLKSNQLFPITCTPLINWPITPCHVIHGYFGPIMIWHVRLIFILNPLHPTDIVCVPIETKVVSTSEPPSPKLGTFYTKWQQEPFDPLQVSRWTTFMVYLICWYSGPHGVHPSESKTIRELPDC